MTKNLIPFGGTRKPHVHYRALAKLFKRPELERGMEPVRDDERHLHAVLPNMKWFTSRYGGPGEQFRELFVTNLRDLGIGPELLLYRVLRDLFGSPDIITVAIPKKALGQRENTGKHHTAWPSEWSFMLKGESEAYLEIRKQPGTQEPHLALWVPKLTEVSKDKKGRVKSDLDALLRELKKTLEHSRHLLDKRAIKAQSATFGPFNIYADMLAAGDEQLVAATSRKKGYRSRRSKDKQAVPVAGTYCLAAATSYLLALEAYVNILGEVLRKDEFRAEVFDRAFRADFEFRLLSLSLFCNGFAKAPFAPDHVSYKQVRHLREFRNNLLHSNLSSDDHVIYMLPEDHFIFHWWPAADLRHHEQSAFERLPLSRVLFTANHAKTVRKHVEASVNSIEEALAPEYQSWAKGWREMQFVPAILKDGHWTPNLGGLKVGIRT